MKKIIFVLTLVLITCTAFLFVGGVAFGAVSAEECDEVFTETVDELLTADEAEDTYLTATKTLLYDLQRMPLGYLYSFTANGEDGFAIIINTNGIYECVEIYFAAQNPYLAAGDADWLYINTMVYWTYADGIFYDAFTGAEIPQWLMDAATEKAYVATRAMTRSSTETIYYTHKSEAKHNLAMVHPRVVMLVENKGCVPVMGANIIQFFDRYSVNLIANYTPGAAIATHYRYNGPSQYTNAVVNQLSGDMNAVDGTATQTDFVDGMQKYCQDRGYTFTRTTCMSGDQFNYTQAKSQLVAGYPIALFVDPFAIQKISTDSGSDMVNHFSYSIAHAMTAFGYREITYTLSNGQTRTDSYLQVATSRYNLPAGYCKLNGGTTIDQAWAININ